MVGRSRPFRASGAVCGRMAACQAAVHRGCGWRDQMHLTHFVEAPLMLSWVLACISALDGSFGLVSFRWFVPGVPPAGVPAGSLWQSHLLLLAYCARRSAGASCLVLAVVCALQPFSGAGLSAWPLPRHTLSRLYPSMNMPTLLRSTG